MILLLETTKWDTPNHAYLVDDSKSKMHGYIKRGTDEMIMFNKPITFDKRYRTFKTIRKNLEMSK